MVKRIEPNLVLGQISNLLNTKIGRNILTPILLKNERDISISVSQMIDARFCFEISQDELNEILGNMEYYYKKSCIPSKIVKHAYLLEAPIHKNGCPMTYEEWINLKVENMELSKEDQKIFDEWNKIMDIPFTRLI